MIVEVLSKARGPEEIIMAEDLNIPTPRDPDKGHEETETTSYPLARPIDNKLMSGRLSLRGCVSADIRMSVSRKPTGRYVRSLRVRIPRSKHLSLSYQTPPTPRHGDSNHKTTNIHFRINSRKREKEAEFRRSQRFQTRTESNIEPFAPETADFTAVVTISSQTHKINSKLWRGRTSKDRSCIPSRGKVDTSISDNGINTRYANDTISKKKKRNFQPKSFLGEDGFGCVFKGWIE
ncbi:hypothetical protein CR513_62373, partial [Mucuna pruriens]